jgi:hypothetical protein
MWPFRRRPAPAPSPRAQVDVIAVHVATTLRAVVDDLAEVFAADPVRTTLLLHGHAAAVLALDCVVADPQSADHECAMAATTADGTYAALLALSPAAVALTRTRTTAQETDR